MSQNPFGEGGFDLAPYPALRGWLARVRATPGFVPMPEPDAVAMARMAQQTQGGF